MPASQRDIERIRKQMAAQMSGRPKDPFEFTCPTVNDNEVVNYRYYVLDGLKKGDKVAGGIATQDMELFTIKNGMHWINKRAHPCPRLFNDEECEICEHGFAMMKGVPDSKDGKALKSAIANEWLSKATFMVNLYFPDIDPNPPEVRGKVLFHRAAKTVFDLWYAALNNNDGGDKIDPRAFGLFYDEMNAFLFQHTIKKVNGYNDYKSSRFLASVGSQPIAVNPDGTPNLVRIQQIMDSRHDLWTKIEKPDPAKIHAVCQRMINGGDSDNTIPATSPDDTHTQSAPAAPPAATTPPPLPPAVAEARAKAAATMAAAEKIPNAVAAEMPVSSPASPVTQAAPAQAAPAQAAAPAAPAVPTKPKTPPAPAQTDDEDDDVQKILANLRGKSE